MSTPQPPGPGATPPQPRPPAPPERSPTDASLPEDDSPSTWQPWLYIKLGLVGAAIAYVVAFIVKNSEEIKLDFVFVDASINLIWALLLVCALGILFGVLLSQLYRHRRREELMHRVRKQRDTRSNLGGRDEAERKPS